MIEDNIVPYLTDVDKTSGFALLYAIHVQVTRYSSERIALPHQRWEEPEAVKDKAFLASSLAQWKVDLDELVEAGAKPSRERALKSLRTLVKNIQELKVILEFNELMSPSNLSNMFKAIERKAGEWAALKGAPRLHTGTKGAHLTKAGGGDGEKI